MIRNKKGFSLIELIVTIVVLGIIASLAIPLYLNYRKKAITIEAKANLSQLYKYEIDYFSEHDTFISDLNTLGFNPEGNRYYQYEITESSTTGFTATASGNIDNDPVLDVWTINDDRNLVHVTQD